MLAFLQAYWWVFVVIVALVVFAVSVIKDKGSAKKWLLYAVAMTEQELGSGTGELKLQQVYDKFIEKFPIISKLVSFETFKKWVDDALDSLEDIIKNNDNIKNVIENKENGEG